MKKNNVYYKKGDNVCLKKVGTHRFDNQIEVVFDLIDGSTAFIEASRVIEQGYSTLSDGDFLWGKLAMDVLDTESESVHVNLHRSEPFEPEFIRIRNEYIQLEKNHGVGDYIYGLIKEVRPNGDLIISLGPTLTGYCSIRFVNKQLIEEMKPAVNKPWLFTISKMKLDDNNRVTVLLSPVSINESNNVCENAKVIWNIDMEMPSLDNIKCPDGARNTFIQVIKEDVEDSQMEKYNAEYFLSEHNMKGFIVNKFMDKLRRGEVEIGINKKRNDYEVTFESDFFNKGGVPISLGLVANYERDYKKKMWILNFFGVSSKAGAPPKEFEKYVDINWRSVLNTLSSIALPENWESRDAEGYFGEKCVLKQYLQMTFYKARLDEKNLSGKGEYFKVNEAGDALFNTGLVNRDYEDIYCYLKRIKGGDKEWCLGGFGVLGYSSEGKQILQKFAEPFPKPVQYITADNYNKTYLNTERRIYIDWEHILEDKFERLPIGFIEKSLANDKELMATIAQYKKQKNNKKMFAAIKTRALDEDNRRLLITALTSAKEMAVKRCRANYKTAIPMYYPRTNDISILLPLNLLHETEGADLALVVSETKEGAYQGETILTPGMAYNDARQICKLDDWL